MWIDSRGLPCVPKAHSHIPAFVLLIKALEDWRCSHGGAMPQERPAPLRRAQLSSAGGQGSRPATAQPSHRARGVPPQTAAEKDAFRAGLDAQQLAPAQDEENWVEAKQQARHAYAPFEVPGEVRALFSDEKVRAVRDGERRTPAPALRLLRSRPGSAPDLVSCLEATGGEPFWVIVAALKRFVENEGRGCLPLSGALPDMHSDTKSFIQLQVSLMLLSPRAQNVMKARSALLRHLSSQSCRDVSMPHVIDSMPFGGQDLYKAQAVKEQAAIEAHVQAILAEAGLPGSTV